MGNSGSAEDKGFKRKDSLRSSKVWKKQMKPQGKQKPRLCDDGTERCTDHRTKDKDATEKECLLNLKQRLSQHESIIDSLVNKIELQKGMNDRNLLPDFTNESVIEAPCPAELHSKQMEDAEDTLKQKLKPYGSLEKALKTSFTNVYCEINNCLKLFGKDDLSTCIQHGKLVPDKRIHDGENTPFNTTATVQLFCIHEGNTIKEIEKGITTTLVTKLGDVKFTYCQNASDIDDHKLLIVPYIVTSRVGADAENAVKDIPNPGNTALVLIHNKEAHALPSQGSNVTLTDQRFKHLRGIYDLAFTNGNGFYRCDMNKNGFHLLCSFCKLIPFGEKL